MTDNFDKDAETVIELYDGAIGQSATGTWKMIEQYGKIEAMYNIE